MIETFKKYICSNCKGQCDKGIILINNNEIRELRCVNYEKKEEIKDYERPKGRTAKQIKPLMRFKQEY